MPMRITSRKTTIAFFITLGVCIAVAATVLSTSWIILNWREIVPLILGVISLASSSLESFSTRFFWYARFAATSSRTVSSMR